MPESHRINSSEPVVAIVVAAGSGVRLGGDRPKALTLLGGRPLIAHALDALAAGGVGRAVVVVADGLQDEFTQALRSAPIPCTVTAGGAFRQESVARGLAAMGEASVVLVHDAARPLVPARVVQGVIDAVVGGATAAVPVVEVVDTIRQVDEDGSHLVDRTTLRAVQTPQGFNAQILVEAHDAAAGQELTDDAAVCEAAGYPVLLVAGSRESLKITEPSDLVAAEAILARRAAA